MRSRASLGFLAAVALVVAAYPWVPLGAQDVLYDLVGAAAVVAIVIGVRLHRPASSDPWYAFAAGLGLFAAGDIAFSVYDLVGRTAPVPSVADAFYLVAYPALAAGVLLVVRRRSPGSDIAGVLDGLMVAGGVSVLAWSFVMRPYAADRSLDLAAQIVPIAYPALDLLLVAVLTRLVVRGGREPAFRLLAGSVVVLVVADIVYGTLQARGTYQTGSYVDLGWLVAYGLWGAAALHPSMRRLTEPVAPRPPRRSRLGVLLLTLTAAVVPVALVVADVRGDELDQHVLEVASIVMFVLVMARVAVLTDVLQRTSQRLGRAAHRQRVLAGVAVALLGVDSDERVAEVVTAAAVALVQAPGAWAAWEVDGNRLASVGSWAATDDAVRRDVTVDGEVVGTIVVGGIGPSSAALRTDLDLLCSQSELALRAVASVAERVQSRSERLFRAVVQGSSDMAILIDAEGYVLYTSPSILATTGHRPEQVLGTDLGDWLHPDDFPVVASQFANLVAGTTGSSTHFECRVVHADGTWRTVDAELTNLLGDPDVGAVVVNGRDVSVRRMLEEELHRQLLTDTLTGLPNRTLFADRVAHALSRAARGGVELAVVVLDLDDFKVVNDSLGHPVGDALLVELAARLRHTTRPADTIARLGGDEFAILLEGGRMPEAAQQVAERVLDAVRIPFAVHGGEAVVGVSLGIVTALGTERVDDLLRDGELAMYAAKRAGKGRFVRFRPPMHEAAVRRLEVAGDLRRAIDAGDVVPFYQPIVDTSSGELLGVEALARWHHPTRGIVAPHDFIPVAEATGLVVPLGRSILEQACREVQQWRAAGQVASELYVSVNLSARQLQESAIEDDVREALDVSGLPPTSLVLEITESTLIEDLQVVVSRVHALKERGVRVAVDDFGTGYSSLSYLSNLPIDIVKIDKFFVDRVTEGPEGRAMVRGVLELARTLGLRTTAEGVETAQQRAALEELGCESLQGYLFAPALPATELVAWSRVMRRG